jgi:hypothetical protein
MVFIDPPSTVVTLIRIVIQRFGLLWFRALFWGGPEPKASLRPSSFEECYLACG